MSSSDKGTCRVAGMVIGRMAGAVVHSFGVPATREELRHASQGIGRAIGIRSVVRERHPFAAADRTDSIDQHGLTTTYERTPTAVAPISGLPVRPRSATAQERGAGR
jgi:hypothetical protein